MPIFIVFSRVSGVSEIFSASSEKAFFDRRFVFCLGGLWFFFLGGGGGG